MQDKISWSLDEVIEKDWRRQPKNVVSASRTANLAKKGDNGKANGRVRKLRRRQGKTNNGSLGAANGLANGGTNRPKAIKGVIKEGLKNRTSRGVVAQGGRNTSRRMGRASSIPMVRGIAPVMRLRQKNRLKTQEKGRRLMGVTQQRFLTKKEQF